MDLIFSLLGEDNFAAATKVRLATLTYLPFL